MNAFANKIPRIGIQRFVLNNLARMINRYLLLDEKTHQRLEKLQDRIVTIELLPFHFIFQLIFTPSGVEIKEGGEEAAETIVRGTPLQMLHMFISRDNRKQFFAEDLQIEGNADLGQQVVDLFDEMDIDWEEQLAKVTGDVPSYHIHRIANGVQKWLKKTTATLRDDVSDFLHEETLWLPSKTALNEFYHEIDTLRMDVDRIEARFKHLKTTLPEED